MTPSPLEPFGPFLEQARWFGGKGRDFRVRQVRRVATVPALEGDAGRASQDGEHEPGPLATTIELVEVEYADPGGGDELYQVPLAFYPAPQDRLTHALVGEWEDPDLGACWVYDALHDRRAMAGWLAAFDRQDRSGPLRFRRLPGHDLDLGAHSTLFSGEQSNSSVAFGEDALLKVFRRITPGVNPDVAIHAVLTEAGSDHVAALYGWLEAEPTNHAEAEPADDRHGDDGGDGDGPAVLHLAMLQQFLRTASDGWELALGSVRNLFAEGDLHADEVGGDFAGEAARLGTALAEVHAGLREHFPHASRGTEGLGRLAAAMHHRLDDALVAVPALGDHEIGLRGIFDELARLPGLTVQQVHGDLHLGQTLRTSRGWKIVDFEGEPARPLAERLLPDSRWRDVAGMLRSFDYVPAVVDRSFFREGDDTGVRQREFRGSEWSARNRDAFLHAYAGEQPVDEADRLLLRAYVADKAVYETVYETRNRPDWVDIPLAAIARLEA